MPQTLNTMMAKQVMSDFKSESPVRSRVTMGLPSLFCIERRQYVPALLRQN